MPKLKDMFPSKYLKASDFDETGSVLTIERIKEESIGAGKDADEKWVLYFEENDKGLVLNKTNTNIIAGMYGDDTDDWIGKLVTLYATETSFQGEQVECIRIKKKPPKPSARKPAPAAAKAPANNEPDEEEGDGDHPF